ncbi:MAG: DUF3592 domain-containing protein [Lachnospiraceae bacterium]|nr:DUF3592 domain-containing protein [Lachnospiraceae bacterium]
MVTFLLHQGVNYGLRAFLWTVAVWAGLSLFAGLCLRLLHLRRRAEMKRETVKTIAVIDNWENETDYDAAEHSSTTTTYVDYHFEHEGEVFHGYHEEIGPFTRGDRITIFYNPLNPRENMSQYNRNLVTGWYGVKVCGIIFGVLFLLLFTIVL